jgi:hypothetical protein
VVCTSCDVKKPSSSFSKKQLGKGASFRRCKDCVDAASGALLEGLQAVVEDKSNSRESRDLAHMMMRNALPSDVGDKKHPFVRCVATSLDLDSPNSDLVSKLGEEARSSSHGATKETLEAWARALAFEHGGGSESDGEAAVRDGAHAVLLDHSKLAMPAICDPRKGSQCAHP